MGWRPWGCKESDTEVTEHTDMFVKLQEAENMVSAVKKLPF